MARLPKVGGDNGNWGDILNDYLSQELNPDGSLKIRTDGTLSSGIADGSITASKLSPTVNNYLASAQTAVQTVNGKSGQSVTLNASDVSAVAVSAVGAAGGVATLDGSNKLTATQLPGSVVLSSVVGVRYFDEFGAAGDGVTDDTAAVQTAINASAVGLFEVRGRKGAVYKVSRQGTKSFLTGGGNTLTGRGYCLQVPSGTRVDFGGATVQHAAGQDNVVLSNERMTATGDVVQVRNVVIDGGGAGDTTRTMPMIWFYGCADSTLEGIHLQNCSYVAAQVAACYRCRFDRLTCNAVRGQGWLLGGNSLDQITDCEIGMVKGWDVRDYGTFNQPGNPVTIGGRNLRIRSLLARNSAGGVKYLPGCCDVHTDYAEFDGQLLYTESSNATSNCGVKVQGDAPTASGTAVANGTTLLTSVTGTGYAVGQSVWGPQIPEGTTIAAIGSGTLTISNPVPTGSGLSISAGEAPPPNRMTFGTIRALRCAGRGAYIVYSGLVQITKYVGYKNSRLGVDPCFDAANFDRIQVGALRTSWAGLDGVKFSTGGQGHVDIDQCSIRNPGDVTTANVNGLIPGQSGDCYVGLLDVRDDRSTVLNFQGISALSGGVNTVYVGRMRAYNTSAPIRIQTERHFVGDPVISSGTDANSGTFTPAAAATSTTVSNSNIRNPNYNSGYVNPVIEVTPLNAAAQTLLATPIRYTVPASFQLKFWHGSAAGSEVFRWRLIGYAWSASQIS